MPKGEVGIFYLFGFNFIDSFIRIHWSHLENWFLFSKVMVCF